METQVAVLPQPQPKEDPIDILLRIRQNSLQGDNVDTQAFFQDVWLLDCQGAANTPKVRTYLHFLGSKPVIGTGLINQLILDSQQTDTQALGKDIKVAQILGLDQKQNPKTLKFLDYLKTKYNLKEEKVQTPSRSRQRKLVLAAASTALAASAAGLFSPSDTTPSTHIESFKDLKPHEVNLPDVHLPNILAQVDSAIQEARERIPKWSWGTEQPVNLFEKIIEPFVQEAYQKRQERADQDPEYFVRVDQQLNQNRINLVLFAYSEEHGDKYENYGGFPTILSYDLKTGQVGIVHFSRDIRVPELERKFPEDSIENQRVRRIYKKGGFEGMRWICEEMSGLAIDYQIVLKDVVVRDAIQKLADSGLEIDVAKDHEAGPFRFDRVEYGDGFIPKGKQIMDTTQLIQYISAEDKEPGGKEDERSYRKNQVLEALTQKLKEKIKTNPTFLVNILNFLREETESKNIEVDFDLNLLTKGGQVIQGLTSALIRSLGGTSNLQMQLPELDPTKQHVFHDSLFGDGGVTRVHHIQDNQTNAWKNKPEIFTKLQKEDLPFWMLIPDGGDPNAQDLIANYWQSVRSIVREKLLQN